MATTAYGSVKNVLRYAFFDKFDLFLLFYCKKFSFYACFCENFFTFAKNNAGDTWIINRMNTLHKAAFR